MANSPMTPDALMLVCIYISDWYAAVYSYSLSDMHAYYKTINLVYFVYNPGITLCSHSGSLVHARDRN